ncbi:hypothetical protein LFYK43_11170 [Ligilactobacillus salitolerans]|uniref:Uncharacterized protein n=1 Tax=Ligilactobacillus salitolerans TaxID=1808352 RepID=A0A401IT05_9LACO|nr:hypothetical protein [Ligilactobacillus salitolerans]GBG94658.1 hypothetical protein LFYK43_11170 [Ligilactobacillus salitolerans]
MDKKEIAKELLEKGYSFVNEHITVNFYQMTGQEFLDDGWTSYDGLNVDPKDKFVALMIDDDRQASDYYGTYDPDSVRSLSDYDSDPAEYLKVEFINNNDWDDQLEEVEE